MKIITNFAPTIHKLTRACASISPFVETRKLSKHL